ncbi:MAG: class I SAM-dependent methyltransferase [Gemmatimonadota bacterium]|jgi:SAM-dependent methyltransferase|nr:hypothetical protein [Gemmatimonadota bacterium]MDP6461783.1 class I SAM-dependent methyltransferase [Gemmatimonadota bacterium]MDP6529447.1 class I SAM-dependent methyltransferase [Gemmatimonadota bacterium]MDP6802625.1 class I SAM-dependent methyltransferase [Gemmatimonadota bacterium]MDP7030750.1 class I SAM-dependent methyltransferase [Gemmatimonadota bacterium]
MAPNDDRSRTFERTEYRRVIAWPERIRREAPFLSATVGQASPRRLLDVGCGTGEHAAHFAGQGWDAVGIDIATNMIDDALELEGAAQSGGSLRFEVRAAAEAGGLPDAPFGAAICLGNTLAFHRTEEELLATFRGIAAALAPGGLFLFQLLNYRRILEKRVRDLAPGFRPLPEEEGDGEIVFARFLDPKDDGTVDFYPVTLTLRPDSEEPVRLRSARCVTHRGWVRAELEDALTRAGFSDFSAFGTMAEVPYDPECSPDLVMMARRTGGE